MLAVLLGLICVHICEDFYTDGAFCSLQCGKIRSCFYSGTKLAAFFEIVFLAFKMYNNDSYLCDK